MCPCSLASISGREARVLCIGSCVPSVSSLSCVLCLGQWGSGGPKLHVLVHVYVHEKSLI